MATKIIDDKKETVIIRESFIESVASDIVTFGLMLTTGYINLTYISSSFIWVLLWAMFLIFLLGKTIAITSARMTKCYTRKDALKAIDNLYGYDDEEENNK